MKKIQKYKLIICGMLAGFFLSGCTDLEIELTDSILVESETGSFEGDPTALLGSAYRSLNGVVGSSYTGVSGLNEPTSDEMIIPTRSTDWGNGGVFRVLHTHTWDPAHSYILSVWNSMNQAVYYCNQVLASNPTEVQAAEAKALRAYYMYNVIDLFGQVPFREVDQGVDEYPIVMNRSDAFDFVIDDLESAQPFLDAGGPDSDHTLVSEAFVNALLARLYLNKAVYKATNPAGSYDFNASDMNKVIEYCDAVQAAGFVYEPDYFTNFTADGGKEHILTFANWWSGMWIWPQLHNAQGGWNGASTLESFYNKFEENDQRIGYVPSAGIGRGFLIGQQYGEDSTELKNRSGGPLAFTAEVYLTGNPDYTGIRVLKYDPVNAGAFVLMRYADVRLMKAEAILRGGSPTNEETAQSIVDELRTVRGASIKPVDLDMILDERGRELYWEGIRRIDQIRFETFTKTTWEYKTSTDDTRVLFSIPQRAMDSNPNLTQNEGY